MSGAPFRFSIKSNSNGQRTRRASEESNGDLTNKITSLQSELGSMLQRAVSVPPKRHIQSMHSNASQPMLRSSFGVQHKERGRNKHSVSFDLSEPNPNETHDECNDNPYEYKAEVEAL
eukprot:325119_1